MVNFKKINRRKLEEIYLTVRNSAANIIDGKGATFFGIGAGAAYVVKCLLSGQQTILPLSHLTTGQYGLIDVCLSLPTVIGHKGVMGRPVMPLSDQEMKFLHKSAARLQEVYQHALAS